MDKNIRNGDDLLTDDSFLRWVTGEAGDTERTFWEAWLEADAANRALYDEAMATLRLLRFKGPMRRVDVRKGWRRLEARIERHERGVRSTGRPGSRRESAWYYRLAAAILLTFLAAAGYWFSTRVYGFETVRTDYGEKTEVRLPDGSSVTLNGNSRLVHKRKWSPGGPREVTLEGEAFFSVRRSDEHTNLGQFLVHTPSGQVTVVGTEFNVTDWGDLARVVVTRGKVLFAGKADSVARQTSVLLMPNQAAEFRTDTEAFEVRTVNPKVYTSWRSTMLVFDNTPIYEILHRLEWVYGLKVRVEDEAILAKQVSGKIENRKEVLLRGLANLLNRRVVEERGMFIIK
ncbi:MAG: DUF4974 domain-containing protein [Calditrichaeota bacterium]|nr:MAG: DUF4974 domain-containing protein [Calditrichota bacterium]